MKTCLIIPFYNHEHAIAKLLAALQPLGLVCLLINDGSAAPCTKVLDECAKQYSDWLTLIHRAENGGKGAAVLDGFNAAIALGFTHAIQLDADGQHDVADIPRFLELSRLHPDALIIGQPIFDESAPKSRRYARQFTNLWIWINTLSFTIGDGLCGFRLYPLEAVQKLINTTAIAKRMDFDIDILVRLYWQGCVVINQPTKVSYPQDGVSHFDLWRDNVSISKIHARLFFGLLRRFISFPRAAWKCSSAPHRTKNWANLEEHSFVWGMRFLLRVYLLIGRTGLQLFLYPVVSYYWLSNRTARHASQAYLQKLSEFGLTHQYNSYQHFISFANAIIDKLAAWSGALSLTDVRFHGRDNLLNELKKGRGVVLFASHLGNTEVCRVIAATDNAVRINVLVHTKHAEKFNQLLKQYNSDSGLNLIQVTDINVATSVLLSDKIANGELVIIAADRTPVNNTQRVSTVDFLGVKAPFPQGAFILAALLDCPVYTLFCLKDREQYTIHFEHFSDRLHFPRKQRDTHLQQTIQSYATRLEQHCLNAPLQWFNFFDFWAEHE